MRQLSPYVFVGHYPVGWKCSECGQVFRLLMRIVDPTTYSKGEPDEGIKTEFLSHTCKSGC